MLILLEKFLMLRFRYKELKANIYLFVIFSLHFASFENGLERNFCV